MVDGMNLRGSGMTTQDIFDFADGCIEAGFFPRLTGSDYVLGLSVPGTGRAIIHRRHIPFTLHTSCRIWLLSGKVREFLGDSSALPGDLADGVRPPFTV